MTHCQDITFCNWSTEGNKRAASALKLADSYDKVLSTILIGNNIVNIMLSSISTVWFIQALQTSQVKDWATAISTATITVVVLIFGEITPKSIAKDHAEGFSMAIAPILRFLIIVLMPINVIFMLWKKLINKIFKTKTIDTVTEGEV